MLYLYEVHAVIGEHEVAFEEAAREAFLTVLPSQPDARLLWYLDSTHGSGEGYKVNTITAFADAAAYDTYLDRVLSGDLAAWMRQADEMRYSLEGTLVVDAVPDSPVFELSDVPLEGERPTAMLRLDFCHPESDPAQLYAALGDLSRREPQPGDTLTVAGAFVPALSLTDSDAALVLYRIGDIDDWFAEWMRGEDEWRGAMAPVPSLSRSSRLLRTSTWSPLS